MPTLICSTNIITCWRTRGQDSDGNGIHPSFVPSSSFSRFLPLLVEPRPVDVRNYRFSNPLREKCPCLPRSSFSSSVMLDRRHRRRLILACGVGKWRCSRGPPARKLGKVGLASSDDVDERIEEPLVILGVGKWRWSRGPHAR